MSDCFRRGVQVQAAVRIIGLMNELNFKSGQVGLIITRAQEGKLDEGTMKEIRKKKLKLLGVIPHDDMVYWFDCNGKPAVQLPEDSSVRITLCKIM